MNELFLTILNMSLSASVVILAVLLARLLLRRAPKKWSYLLWSVAGFRLCCPVSFRAVFSIFRLSPLRQSEAAVRAALPSPALRPAAGVTLPLSHGAPVTGAAGSASPALSPALPAAATPAPELWPTLGTVLWCLGLAALLLYGVVSYLRLRRDLADAVQVREKVYESGAIRSPFILGFWRPRVYLPLGLAGDRLSYVLAHENVHLRRRDYLVKPFAFLLLAVHWFNPLCWLAFFLMNRDMEMSCDEAVLAQGGAGARDYSLSLLSFALPRRFPAPGPLAFGETGVKSRVKNVLSWRRPRTWVTLGAIVLCVAVLAACAADPAEKPAETIESIIPPGEAGQPANNAFGRDESKVSAYLTSLPWDYHELAERTDVIFNAPESLYPAEDVLRRWYAFYGTVQAGQPACVTTARLGAEGQLIYTYADYDGEDFWVMRDLTRDSWAGEDRRNCAVYLCSKLRQQISPREGRYWVCFPLEGGDFGNDLYEYWSEDAEAIPTDASSTVFSAQSAPPGTEEPLPASVSLTTLQLPPALLNLQTKDIDSVSLFNGVGEPALVAAALRAAQPAARQESGLLHWNAEVRLKDGTLLRLAAGPEENLVDVFCGDYDPCTLESAALYTMIRDSYSFPVGYLHTDYERYAADLADRAEALRRQINEEAGAEVCTGWEALDFRPVTVYDAPDDALYVVYSLELAFPLSDPDRAVWAGGLWLDNQLRLRGLDPGWFVTRRSGDRVETAFLDADWWFFFNQAGQGPVLERLRALYADSGSGVATISGVSLTGIEYTVDLDGDGAAEKLLVNPDSSGRLLTPLINGVDYTGVLYDESDIEAARLGRGTRANPDLEHYMIVDLDLTDGYKELAFMDYGPSDDYTTSFYRYENGTLRHLGTVEGLITYDSMNMGFVLDGAGRVYTTMRLSVLQTWWAEVCWELSGEGVLELRPQEVYDAQRFAYVTMDGETKTSHTLLRDVLAYDDRVGDSAAILPAGAEITLTGTDNREWVRISTAEGEERWLRLDTSQVYPVNVETPKGFVYAGEVIAYLNYAD